MKAIGVLYASGH